MDSSFQPIIPSVYNLGDNERNSLKRDELLKILKDIALDRKSFLFGMEFFNSFRSTWNDQASKDTFVDGPWRSDCCDVIGRHPAILGQDFHYYIEKDEKEVNYHLKAATIANNWGCLLTFDFHMVSRYGKQFDYTEEDKYLVYNIGTKKTDEYGEITWFHNELDRIIEVMEQIDVPMVLRLFHECNGDWFWWGTKSFHNQADVGEYYRNFYQYTVTYIKSKTNLALFAWSPNYPFDANALMYYPGDDFVDVVGLDIYDVDEDRGPSWDDLRQSLRFMGNFARKHDKIVAITEAGNRIHSPSLENNDWWIKFRDVVLELKSEVNGPQIAWLLSWFNAPWETQANGGDMIPHRYSSQDAQDGFRRFASHPGVRFTGDI